MLRPETPKQGNTGLDDDDKLSIGLGWCCFPPVKVRDLVSSPCKNAARRQRSGRMESFNVNLAQVVSKPKGEVKSGLLWKKGPGQLSRWKERIFSLINGPDGAVVEYRKTGDVLGRIHLSVGS